jgi:hypothetical protein
MAKKRKGDYEVGYGKPPVGTRFVKGTSGNYRGRKPGSKNRYNPERFSNSFLEESRRLIEVRENGKLKTMPNYRALIRKVFGMAGAGNIQAMKIVMDELREQESRLDDRNSALFAAAVDFKKNHAEESKQRKMRGDPEPEYMYHPDDFHLNFETESVTYAGLTAAQEEYFRMLLQMKIFLESSLISLVDDSSIHEGDHMSIVWEDVKHIVHMLEKINAACGAPWGRDLDNCPDLQELRKLKENVLKEPQK